MQEKYHEGENSIMALLMRYSLIITLVTISLTHNITMVALENLKKVPVTALLSFASGLHNGLLGATHVQTASQEALLVAGPLFTFCEVVGQSAIPILQHIRMSERMQSENPLDTLMRTRLTTIANIPWFLKTYGSNVTAYIAGYLCYEAYKKIPIKQTFEKYPNACLALTMTTAVGITIIGIRYGT